METSRNLLVEIFHKQINTYVENTDKMIRIR